MPETKTMSTYVVECTCGHDLKVDAENRDDAIRQMKMMMDKKGVEDHFRTYHRAEPVMSVEEAHTQIEKKIKEM